MMGQSAKTTVFRWLLFFFLFSPALSTAEQSEENAAALPPKHSSIANWPYTRWFTSLSIRMGEWGWVDEEEKKYDT